jgi:hypothetical protein
MTLREVVHRTDTIESGERPVLDYELTAFAKALKVPIQALFD